MTHTIQIYVDDEFYRKLIDRKGKRTWIELLDDEVISRRWQLRELKRREAHWNQVYNQLKTKYQIQHNIINDPEEKRVSGRQQICYVCRKPVPEDCCLRVAKEFVCPDCFERYEDAKE